MNIDGVSLGIHNYNFNIFELMNLLSIFFSKKILIPSLFLFTAVFLYSLWERIPDIDDAWIGEYAYWFAKDGYVHSELMRGINMQETNFVVHHKLFNLNGAILECGSSSSRVSLFTGDSL